LGEGERKEANFGRENGLEEGRVERSKVGQIAITERESSGTSKDANGEAVGPHMRERGEKD